MPSIMVVGLPNFRVSSLMRILCCSFSISPQTHKSFGSPHVEQTSAMTLISELPTDVYKSFKKKETKLRIASAKYYALYGCAYFANCLKKLFNELLFFMLIYCFAC